MGIARKTLYFLIALPLAALTLYVLIQVWPDHYDTPITCMNDTTCGGVIEVKRVCQDNAIYAEGQRNTCVHPGTRISSCDTQYDPWLIETCDNGCENGACI